MDRFHKLFWEVYSRNCEIENLEVDKDDLENIKKLDREKLYKTFRSLIHNLLDFKTKAKTSDLKELAEKNLQFEAIITKLEADSRSHIAKHYQLRLEIESQKNSIDELNAEVLNGKNEIRQLKAKVLQQDRALEVYKARVENTRKSVERKSQVELEGLDQIKSGKNTVRVLSDRNKISGPSSRNTLIPSRSLKGKISHMRCKSELTNSLKIIIP